MDRLPPQERDDPPPPGRGERASVSNGLGRPPLWRRLLTRGRNRIALVESRIGFARRGEGEQHGLPRPLIVSITSYPKRFETLAPTLRSLLSQRIRPDKVVLWTAPETMHLLPENVRELEPFGLDIRPTEDIGPFTKIVPALKAFPDAFIATADDDVFYGREWLAMMVKAWPGDFQHIVCHRAHRVTYAADGRPKPYAQWTFEVSGPETSDSLFPTGVGGVLYPPGSLGSTVVDRELFQALCPQADDLWLYFMGRRSGSRYVLVGPRRPVVNWPGSQRVALYHANVRDGGNQVQLERLIAHFGWPGSGG